VAAAAARFVDCSEDELWYYFISRLTNSAGPGEVTVGLCPDVLSVCYTVGHGWEQSAVPPFGKHSPVGAVLALAEAGQGLFGVVHGGLDEWRTFRAWSVSTNGVEAVNATKLSLKVGLSDAVYASGWPSRHRDG
jgi:hypothetical protein